MVIGAFLLATRLFVKWRGGPLGHADVPLEILRRIPCGPRQGVALLRAGSRVLVVSVSDRGATLLTELTGEDARDALTPRAPRPVAVSSAPGWRTALMRLPFVLALLMAAAPAIPAAAAQQTRDPVRTEARVQTPEGLPEFSLQVGDGDTGLEVSGAVGVVILMSVLTLLPALFLMMTSFTRILIVLHFLRSALGTQTTPPGQLLVAIAVLLTGVVMAPTLERANQTALQPYLEGRMTQVDAYKAAILPFRDFMLANTRTDDLGTFATMTGETDVQSVEELSTVAVMAAFVISELKTAFQIGFVIFLPFTVVDLVVASVLMSMGMFMLPPVMISLPFKLLLFVLADGWTLVVQNLVASFNF